MPQPTVQLADIVATGQWDKLPQLAVQAPELRNACMCLDAFVVGLGHGDIARVKALLQPLWDAGYRPEDDPALRQSAPDARIELDVALGVTLTLALDREAVGLTLAEALQHDGDLLSARQVCEALPLTDAVRVALVDVLSALSSFSDVVRLTDGVVPQSAFGACLLLDRAVALRHLGHPQAAGEVCTAALGSSDLAAQLRNGLLLERAEAGLLLGMISAAAADAEQVLAHDSTCPGLNDLLARVRSAQSGAGQQ